MTYFVLMPTPPLGLKIAMIGERAAQPASIWPWVMTAPSACSAVTWARMSMASARQRMASGSRGRATTSSVGGDPIVAEEEVELGVAHDDEQWDRVLAEAQAPDGLEQAGRVVARVEDGEPDRQLGFDDGSEVGRRFEGDRAELGRGERLDDGVALGSGETDGDRRATHVILRFSGCSRGRWR